MNRAAWTALSMTVALCFAGCAAKEEWRSVSQPDGRYTVEMPADVKDFQQQVATDAGPTTLHGRICEVQRGHVAYAVMYCDYSPELVAATTPQELLQGSQEGSMTGVDNANVASETEETFQGFPSRRFVVTGSQSGVEETTTTRIVLVGNRLYQQLLMETGGYTIPKESKERFFNSFKIDAPTP